MTAQPVALLASEIRLMDSQHTGRKYRITISLPMAYNKLGVKAFPFDTSTNRWPVIYLLDSNIYFGMVTDTVRGMAWCGRSSDAIVVGIGYDEDPNPIEVFHHWNSRRNLDLTPVRDEGAEKWAEDNLHRPSPTGDAANFYRFIKDELMPAIERDFSTDPTKRILIGHSYGGLFAAFALFEQPDLFKAYVMGSPSLEYGERCTFKREAAFAEANQKLPANVYLFVGDLEEGANDTTMTDTLRFAALLQSRNYEGLSVTKQVFADQNHCEVVFAGFQGGLKFALKKS